MDNIIQDLSLNFAGANGEINSFRINGLYGTVTSEKANAAMDIILATGAFVDDTGPLYTTPINAVLTTTETKTISER
ncbi:DUF2922 family protein [Lacticaseibacillus sp. GG6-2]